jgi:hypothetical protein
VSLKRLTEAQNFEDEMKQVTTLNETLLARNQELVTQLVEESQEEIGKYLNQISFNYNHA